MSLLWKVAVLTILIAVASSSIPHRHHKEGHFTKAEDLPSGRRMASSGENARDVQIQGKIHCNGVGYAYARPYIADPKYPTVILNIVATNSDGWYRLSTGTIFDDHDAIVLTVRHQCEMEHLQPMAKCAVPYYTTNIRFDVRNTTYIGRNFDLGTMEDYTSSDCLGIPTAF